MNAPTLPSSHVQAGQKLAPFTLSSLAHGDISVPGKRRIHLQFHRFAGCPICNLHVRAFSKRHTELEQAGLQTVVLFYSTAEEMKPYQGDLPFPAVADPQRVFFNRFGLERSALAALHPAAAFAAMKGLLTVKSNLLVGSGGTDGLPADFLIDTDGTVLAAQYGRHPADLWSVDEVLALAKKPA